MFLSQRWHHILNWSLPQESLPSNSLLTWWPLATFTWVPTPAEVWLRLTPRVRCQGMEWLPQQRWNAPRPPGRAQWQGKHWWFRCLPLRGTVTASGVPSGTSCWIGASGRWSVRIIGAQPGLSKNRLFCAPVCYPSRMCVLRAGLNDTFCKIL